MISRVALLAPMMGKPDWYFHDNETDRNYRRIHGGIAWPGASVGAVVVLGEELERDGKLNERKLWVLGEHESQSPADIVDGCQGFRSLLQVEEFAGDTTNHAMMSIFNNSNSDFYISKAPFIDNAAAVSTYLSIIREKVSATRKVLNFGNSALPAKLGNLTSIRDGNSILTEFQHIAALGYALASLVLDPYTKPIDASGASYPPLDEGVGI
jgi:hypothetical protein